MRKSFLLTLIVGITPLCAFAQDDVYFTPSKSVKQQKSTDVTTNDQPVYYRGCDRDVDEYNRRGKFSSYYQKIGTDSLGNDIIEFHSSAEDIIDTLSVYPGTDIRYDDEDDYACSRRMSRFDDYYWYDPWFFGYYHHSPYWYGRYGWYDPWYDPWYYGYYSYYGWGYPYYGYGWYDPWYYGYYGWGYPYYGWYGRPYITSTHFYRRGVTGTRNHGYVGNNRSSRYGTSGAGHFGGYRGNGQSSSTYNRAQQQRRSSNSTFSNSRYSGSRTPSYSSGSFGGTRSSGGSFGGGGSHSSGGGHTGGGGHFGGRR